MRAGYVVLVYVEVLIAKQRCGGIVCWRIGIVLPRHRACSSFAQFNDSGGCDRIEM
jgi:hypothetical protein